MRFLQQSEKLEAPAKSEIRTLWQTIVSWHAESGDGGYDWSQGVRAAVGIAIPISIGLATGHLSWGILTALAAFWTLMCDMGGAYRQKAIAIGGFGFLFFFAFVFCAWVTQPLPAHIIRVFFFAVVVTLLGGARESAPPPR